MSPESSTMPGTRPLAILVTGPLHLFRTTGIYYAFALAQHYDVVIVGFDNYAGDTAVETARKWPGIQAIETLPTDQHGFRFHRAAAVMAKTLAHLQPTLVLQHSESYPHNLYIASAMPDCAIQGSYANGMTLDQDEDFRYVRYERIAALARRFHIPLLLAPLTYDLRAVWNNVIHYTLFPFLLTRRSQKPRQNPVTGKTSPDRTTHMKFRLMYSRREIAQHHKVLPSDNLVLVKHPMANVAGDVHRSQAIVEERNGIAFLPTRGLTTALAKEIGAEAAFERAYQTWEKTLLTLRARLGPLPIRAKLHPGAADDPLSRKLFEKLARSIEGVQIFDPAFSAEQLVLASSCVVGDVSSILWWTYMLGGRQIVSVNAWDVPLGDEMRYHPSVTYVTDPADLATVSLPISEPRASDAPTALAYILGYDRK